MNEKLKQRIVGASIFLAIGIIAVPMLLDDYPDERAAIDTDIPEPPRIEFTRLSQDVVNARMNELAAPSEPTMPAAPRLVETEPGAGTVGDIEDLTLSAHGMPEAWSLQVGSFAERDKAIVLRATLRERGFRSYIHEVTTDGITAYRVFVGPMLQRAKLDAMRARIEADFGLEGTFTRYSVASDRGLVGG